MKAARVIAAAIATAAIATTPASAEQLDATDIATAQAAAATLFPAVATRCPDGVRVTIGPLPNDQPDRADAAALAPCDVYLEPAWTTWPWRTLCALMAHEYGHLDGRGHAVDPADLMHGHVSVTPAPCALRIQLEDQLEDARWDLDVLRDDARFLRREAAHARARRERAYTRSRLAALRRTVARARTAKRRIAALKIRLDALHVSQ